MADLPEDIGKLTDRPWPAIVIGAGPAGAVCALALARAGHSVLVLDKFDFPRDKICGDQLLPDSLKVLAQLGLLDRIRPLALASNGIRVFSPGRIDFLIRCEYLGIKRRDFDQMLLRAAIEAGATFAKARVIDIKTSPRNNENFTDLSSRGPDPVGAVAISDSRLPRYDVPPHGGPSPLAMTDGAALSKETLAEVYVQERTEPLLAQVVVLATGASVHLADKLGLIERRVPSAVAMRAYIQSDYPLEENVLSYDRSLLPGYGWVFRVEKNLFNVGCGHLYGKENERSDNLRATTESFLANFPIAHEVASRGRLVSDFQGAPFRCGLDGWRQMVKDNVVCIGEVIGTTFPFTGEGIGKAMQSALIASEAIIRVLKFGDLSALDEYPIRVEAELRPRYHGYTIAEEWFSRPWAVDLVARRIRNSPHLQEQLAGLAAETADPRALFSIGSLLQSLWK